VSTYDLDDDDEKGHFSPRDVPAVGYEKLPTNMLDDVQD